MTALKICLHRSFSAGILNLNQAILKVKLRCSKRMKTSGSEVDPAEPAEAVKVLISVCAATRPGW